MFSRTHTRTFATCGARTLLREAYRSNPVGGGLGSHPPTLNLPRRTVTDHHLPKVLLNDGFSDDLHAPRTVTTFFIQARIYCSWFPIFISVSSGTFV